MLQSQEKSFEIIFIDDGSTDNTLEKIKVLGCSDLRVRYIVFSRNFGHQNALRAGIDRAIGDCIVSLDADMQHPPELIPEMIRLWENGNDIVSALRKNKYPSIYKQLTSATFYKIFNRFSSEKLPEGNADFRLLDRKVADVIASMPEKNIFLRGLISWVGFKQVFLHYKAATRNAGRSSFSSAKMIGLAISGITSHSIAPLRVSLFIGIGFASISIMYAFYAITTHLIFGTTVPGWTSLIASIMFISALQFVILGIMGEYLGKLFIESKKRPHYIVKETNIEEIGLKVSI